MLASANSEYDSRDCGSLNEAAKSKLFSSRVPGLFPRVFPFEQTPIGRRPIVTFKRGATSRQPYGRRFVVEFTIFGFLLGVALSLHCRMLVLVPVIPLALAVVATSEWLLGSTILWIAVASALVLTSVQLGYFIGSILLSFVGSEKFREIKVLTRLPS
jgi:hypothetical protein